MPSEDRFCKAEIGIVYKVLINRIKCFFYWEGLRQFN